MAGRIVLLLGASVVIPQVADAQPTSRVIPFVGVVTSIPPGSTGQTLQL
jgi:hypothetical protein